jgi:voltage-gated sodium channel
MRNLMNAFVSAIPRMSYVSLLMVSIFYIYAAMGRMFFSDLNKELWGNITIATLKLFRIATFEEWTDVICKTMAVHPLSGSFYLHLYRGICLPQHDDRIVLETPQREHVQFSRDTGGGKQENYTTLMPVPGR